MIRPRRLIGSAAVTAAALLVTTGNSPTPPSTQQVAAFLPPPSFSLRHHAHPSNHPHRSAPKQDRRDGRDAQRRRQFHRLTMVSSTPSSSSSSSASYLGGGGQVIFQKVVRPPPYLQPSASSSPSSSNTGANSQLADAGKFLGSLVTYLEYGFEVPEGLMVTYDKYLPDDSSTSAGSAGGGSDGSGDDLMDEFDEFGLDDFFNDNGEGIEDEKGLEDEHTVCIFDSSLSSNPIDSRLTVEVVAVYPDHNGDASGNDNLSPAMAMVVVKQPKDREGGTSNNNVMVAGLFDDAKKRIVKALDVGLDDWSEGKVRAEDEGGKASSKRTSEYTISSANTSSKHDKDGVMEPEYTSPSAVRRERRDVFEQTNVKWDRAIIDAEVVEDDDDADDSKDGKDVVAAKSDTLEKKQKASPEEVAKKLREIEAAAEKNASADPGQQNLGDEDFAVKAARARAAASSQQLQNGKAQNENIADSAAKQNQKSQQQASASAAAAAAAAAVPKKKPRPAKTPKEQSADPLPIQSLMNSPAAAAGVTMTSKGPQFRVSLNRPKRPGGKPRAAASVAAKGGSRPAAAKATAQVAPKDSGKLQKVEKASKIAPVSAPPSSSSNTTIGDVSPNNDLSSGEDFAVAAAKARAKAQGAINKSPAVEDVVVSPSPPSVDTERKVNVIDYGSDSPNENSDFDNVMFDGGPPRLSLAKDSNQQESGAPKTKTDAEIEQDVLAEAVKFMPESEDITPEQLLRDVLKFGEEKEKEEAPGTGFASGAFDKAKEMMRNEKQQQRLKVAFQEPKSPSSEQAKFFKNLEKTMETSGDVKKGEPLTPEEELKRIFAAGERLAEGRIVTSADPTAEETIIDDEFIDELIASDKTVPRNAQLLDEELAQFEVRMSKSVDEVEEPGTGRGPNPVFDVMSGPETYNPNVADATTAVNWPGAQPGTRNDVRLPPELREAVDNANFAAKILSDLTEELNDDGKRKYYIGEKELTEKQVKDVRKVVEEAVAVGLIEDPLVLLAEKARLNILVRELKGQEDRFEDIAGEYKDLLLSNNFITIVRDYLNAMIERDLEAKRNGMESNEINEQHQEEREICTNLIQYAQLLLKQVRALGAELEASHLEVIRSICHVAMDPSHSTEEETAMALSDAVQDMRAMFDDSFVAYLKYAIAEEEAKLARAGVLDDPDYNRWLFVLKIIQEGVYKELAKSINRLIEHIWYILRMETKAERRMLLEKLVDDMPTLDVRPFVNVVGNIVSSLGGAVKGEFDVEVVGDMTNKLLQLHRDVNEILPPERIREKSKDADEWAEKRRKQLMEARDTTQKRLANAAETDAYDPDEPRGEIERMT